MHSADNIGALKFSNLLQLDRFDGDLHISHVRLKPAAPHPNRTLQPPLDPEIDDQQRHRILDGLRIFRQRLDRNGSPNALVCHCSHALRRLIPEFAIKNPPDERAIPNFIKKATVLKALTP